MTDGENLTEQLAATFGYAARGEVSPVRAAAAWLAANGESSAAQSHQRKNRDQLYRWIGLSGGINFE